MKTFCPSRGCAINYETTRPNFCPCCGAAMLSSTASSPPAPVRRPQPQQNQDWEEEVEQNDYDLDPSSIRINIASAAPKTVLADHIVGTGSTGFGSRPRVAAKDYKSFEKRMKAEKVEPIEI